jgi:hypothetical protein
MQAFDNDVIVIAFELPLSTVAISVVLIADLR